MAGDAVASGAASAGAERVEPGHQRSNSGFFHKTGFQSDGDTIHFAGDFVIAVLEADGFGFRAAFEHLGAAQLQVLDENHTVAIGQHGAVGIFDDAGGLGGFSCGGAFPFMSRTPSGQGFPELRSFRTSGRLVWS